MVDLMAQDPLSQAPPDATAEGSPAPIRQTPPPEDDYTVAELRKFYDDFDGAKKEEIEEQRVARHYYAADQWLDAKQVATLRKRGQPILVSNRIARKIDGVAGICERMRQDPKAYARTPQHENDAEIASASLRYVMDNNQWKPKSAENARSTAINAIGGIELQLVEGESGQPGDYDITFELTEPDTFFYDPRSMRLDFSDARYMGIAKWLDADVAQEMFPDSSAEIATMMSSGGRMGMQQADRERAWINTDLKRVFVVEIWYLKAGVWRYCYFIDNLELQRGQSQFLDDKGATACRFVMWSANVDHDGDRYGFVRNMKSAQDEINARRSKALHLLNTRRIKMTAGAVEDVEVARTEAARPDGVIVVNPGADRVFEFDDARTLADMRGQLEFLGEAKQEIENFGPNPAIAGEGIQNRSGRAIALTQAAGMAELGPFMTSWVGWKVRLYRIIWANVRAYWTAERFIRITDDEGAVAEFLGVNQVVMDPATGQPTVRNKVAVMDVDIIIDEGPDVITQSIDTYDTMIAMAQKGAAVPPDIIIELAPLPASVKKRLLDRMEKAKQDASQTDPAKAEMQKAEISKTKADAFNAFAAGAKDLASIPIDAAKAQAADTAHTVDAGLRAHAVMHPQPKVGPDGQPIAGQGQADQSGAMGGAAPAGQPGGPQPGGGNPLAAGGGPLSGPAGGGLGSLGAALAALGLNDIGEILGGDGPPQQPPGDGQGGPPGSPPPMGGPPPGPEQPDIPMGLPGRGPSMAAQLGL